MAKKTTKKPTPKRSETADKRREVSKTDPAASPLNGVIPPVEHRFKPGDPPGPGAPKKLKGLQDLILDTFGEQVQITDAEGQRVRIMRLQAMIRTMIIKSPTDRIALLEYVYGKVPQAHLFSKMTDDELIAYITGEAGSDSRSQESGTGDTGASPGGTQAGEAPGPAAGGGG